LVDDLPDASGSIESLRNRKVRVTAPDLIYAEISNAFVRQVRAGELSVQDAVSAMTAVTSFPIAVRENRTVCRIALPLALDTGLTAYDAHYLALAEAEDAVLVTADRAFAAAAASRAVLLE
jgi:predicted nucleic acid-binding protein